MYSNHYFVEITIKRTSKTIFRRDKETSFIKSSQNIGSQKKKTNIWADKKVFQRPCIFSSELYL